MTINTATLNNAMAISRYLIDQGAIVLIEPKSGRYLVRVMMLTK